MTVCRYFQNGTCRYGQNCRFAHVYDNYSYRASSTSGSASGGVGNNNNASHSNGTAYSQRRASGTGYGRADSSSSFNFNQAIQEVAAHRAQEIEQVMPDLHAMLDGRFYLFTVIPGSTPQMNCAHLSDLSAEEIRVNAYESIAKNTFHEYQTAMAALRDRVMQTLRQIIARPQMLNETQPKPSAGSIELHSALISSPTASQPSQFFGFLTHPSTPPQPPVYGGNQHRQSSPATTAQFTPAPHFADPRAQSKLIFADSQSNVVLPLQTAQGANSALPLSAMTTIGSPQQTDMLSPSVSLTSRTPDTQKVVASNSAIHQEDSTYTSLTKLSAADKAAFEARVFTIESLPLVPPPQSLC